MIFKNTTFLMILSVCTLIVTMNMFSAKKLCDGKNNCLNNDACWCYCARMCGPRKKTADDKPVYKPNDPAGYYCYCKQEDYDNMEKCIEKPYKQRS